MTVINWGPMFALGFADIDDQQRRLFELINEFDDALLAGNGRDSLAAVFLDLTSHAVQLFAFEETLIDEHQIPSAGTHKAEHQRLRSSLGDFHTKIQTGTATEGAFLDLLQAWLADHTLKTDQSLARELLARGAKSVL